MRGVEVAVVLEAADNDARGETLALGECTPQRYRAVKERMPAKLRAEMADIHPNWR